MRSPDTCGLDLSGPEEARLRALEALPDMAREKIPDGDGRTVGVSVADEAGEVIYRATLTLHGEWVKKLALV